MESSSETTCNCTLLTINYQGSKNIPSSPSSLAKSRPYYFSQSQSQDKSQSKKTKISLSKSLSGATLNDTGISESQVHIRGLSWQKEQYQQCNIYNGLENPPNFKATQPKLRKKYINMHMQTQLCNQKQNPDLQRTKNTNCDNSVQEPWRKVPGNPRMFDTISFALYNERKQESKGKMIPFDRNSAKEKEEAPSIQVIQHNKSISQQVRRIKTLKELQFRNVESSGGGTSENHVSLVMSVEDPKSEELKGLQKMARKSSSFGRIARTAHIVN